MSYDELGGLLEAEPSRLFDAIEGFLGLGQLTEASARLAGRVKELGESKRSAKSRADALKPALAALTDSRAVQALVQLRRRIPDLGAIRALVTGTASSRDQLIDVLTAIAQLTVAAEAEVTACAEELRAAAVDLQARVTAAADAAGLRAELLAQALRFHDTHGDGPCPVCGTGALDSGRAHRVRDELLASRRQSADLAAARERLRTARALIRPVPAAFGHPGLVLGALDDVRAAWGHAARAPDGDLELAGHLTATAGPLCAAVQVMRAEAGAALRDRVDAWATVAVPLAAWLEVADMAAATAAMLTLAESATKWLRTNTAALRHERLEPLAGKAREIWAQLRQESSVDLGAIRLEGANTRRRVDLRASVDGDDSGALAVMSQGELHALALALFIPRAASDASPFRFLVLDDPIQAMDPSKVDGFVRVLAALAQDRQVLVFSHDDRLPAAVRRMAVPARILEISRKVGSQVEVTQNLDPAQRYLDDARAVVLDDGLSADDKARVVPGLCRLALEAVCRYAFYARALTAGDRHEDVEKTWQAAFQTRARVLLAVNPTGDNLDAWLARKPFRGLGLGICTSALHAESRATR